MNGSNQESSYHSYHKVLKSKCISEMTREVRCYSLFDKYLEYFCKDLFYEIIKNHNY